MAGRSCAIAGRPELVAERPLSVAAKPLPPITFSFGARRGRLLVVHDSEATIVTFG
jgi:hypothetical protein